MNILFTICGRAGSKGLKNKNINPFCGYPLPFYTLAAIELYKKQFATDDIDIVLSTDSDILIQMFEENPICYVNTIKRDISLATDLVPKIDVIRNCRSVMEGRTSKVYDIIIDLDITSPLRTVEDIDNLVKTKKDSDYDVVFSVTNSRRNPYFNMVKKTSEGYERVIASNFNTRQEAPEIYDMNASMYAYSPSFLDTNKNIFDGKCGITTMYDTAVLDLDHKNDFELMEVIAKYLFEKEDLAFKEIKDFLASKIK